MSVSHPLKARSQPSSAGMTWHDYGPIITSNTPRPEDSRPYFGGVGNFNAAWDSANQRWLLLFSEYWIGAAISHDPNGMPETWFKWNGYDQGFSQPGWGGVFTPLPGLESVPGGNPSMSWNVYLNKWLIVYGAWDYGLHISASFDGVTWDPVRYLVGSVDGSRAWYPTLSSEYGPYLSFQQVSLYHADKFEYPDRRKVIKRQIRLNRYD
ncbi:hypothetical protein DFJ74DRAFT_690771 [Hyaloraphidium curvatum]|nr:hypothetical protein DFJ74DRAFT_690771 [Hyaloraphidium curvatum]